MDFDEAPELRTLREAARGLLGGIAAGFGPDGQGPDRATLWAAVREQDWPGLAVPEQYGGSAAPLGALAVVTGECARAALTTTLRSTTCAGLLITHHGSPEQCRRWLPRLAAGAAAAVASAGTARLTGSGGSPLDGELATVPDLDLAELVVAVLPGAGEHRLCVLEPAADQVRSRSAVSGDPLGRLPLDGPNRLGPDQLDVGPALGPDARRHAGDLLAVLVAVDLVAAADALLTRTTEYVRTREQFGRPLGTFQAVQHHVANMAADLECGRLLVDDALAELDAGRPAHRTVAAAKAFTSRAGTAISLMAHQLHGGIGYATESGLFRLSRRVQSDALLGGTATEHLHELAQRYRSGPARTLELDALDAAPLGETVGTRSS